MWSMMSLNNIGACSYRPMKFHQASPDLPNNKSSAAAALETFSYHYQGLLIHLNQRVHKILFPIYASPLFLFLAVIISSVSIRIFIFMSLLSSFISSRRLLGFFLAFINIYYYYGRIALSELTLHFSRSIMYLGDQPHKCDIAPPPGRCAHSCTDRARLYLTSVFLWKLLFLTW